MQATAARDLHFPLGAHIVTPRRWYTHHGIYVGAGQVVHYQGLSSSLRRGPVAKVSLAEFTYGHPVRLHGEADVAYSGIEVGSPCLLSPGRRRLRRAAQQLRALLLLVPDRSRSQPASGAPVVEFARGGARRSSPGRPRQRVEYRPRCTASVN